jgi:hypothetical protein
MSMAYYLQACGRPDIRTVPLYDPHYAPRNGDLIILEPSRRFFETQRYFDALKNSGMSHSEVRVGPVLASTIYSFNSSLSELRSTQADLTLTQLRDAPVRFDNDAQEPAATNIGSGTVAQLSRRRAK